MFYKGRILAIGLFAHFVTETRSIQLHDKNSTTGADASGNIN